MKQTTQYASYMKADLRPSAKEPLDLSPLVGEWVNTKPDSSYLVRVVLTSRDGRLVFRGYGANEPDPIDWGEVEAMPYVAGTSQMAGGFQATYNLDGIETQVMANQKLGVLVLNLYTRYLDGSDRTSHFTREFYHR
ncbi:hypothetical protein QUA71_18665 [Microcoleus sp. MON1_C5]|uniref:hypothetical protein n=1 Tax=Microcoleus sp. MON1_C5 TaxID=2818828 RepID=UPI002FD14DB1